MPSTLFFILFEKIVVMLIVTKFTMISDKIIQNKIRPQKGSGGKASRQDISLTSQADKNVRD